MCGAAAKRNGRQCGKQRYWCVTCHHSFIRQKRSAVSFAQFRAFYQFIVGRVSRKHLTIVQEISRKKVSQTFMVFFDRPLSAAAVWQIFPPSFSALWTLALDGKWLRRNGVVMIYRNVTDRETVWWNWHTSESYVALHSDLAALAECCADHPPTGAISDWKGSIVGSVAGWFGEIPHQRCLAHVERDIKKLLPKYSPLAATQELRRIGTQITQIKTHEEKDAWLLWLATWEMCYGHVLKERSRPVDPTITQRKWWYTHSNIRRAYRILTKDQHHLFEYLDHPEIPTTNNTLEGMNSNFKGKLHDHRGMKPPQQYSFLSWYLTFQKVKTAADLKKLWAIWKSFL